jgi:cyanophycin synthetase
MSILERNVYVGPSLYAHFPVIRLSSTWGAGAVAHRAPGQPAFVDALVAALPGLPSTAAPTARPAASSAACARTRAPGSAMCWSTWRSSCRTSPAKTSPSARRAAWTAARRLHVVYEYEQRDQGIEAGDLAMRCCVRCCPPRCVRPPTGAQRLGLGRARATTSSATRSAARWGPARRRWCGGRGTRHPLAAAQRTKPDPARPRQVPAAHPGHGHGPHQHIAVELAQRQGRDQQDPGHARPAGAAPGTGAQRRTCRARRRTPGLTRWSSSPTTATTAAASAIHLKTTEEVAPAFDMAARTRARVIVETYLRATTTACWWSTASSSPRRAARRARGGRRRAQHPELVDDREPGPAPRHRPREGLTRIELDAQADMMLKRARATPPTRARGGARR